MGRPPCCDKVGIKKGPWTPEEDIILVSYIQQHGPGNWRSVPTSTGLLRCSKSCRLRWTNYLRPGIKRGNFTPHEEGMIIHLQALLGNKWAAIASYLPQRTDNDIKNYWNTHLKKKLKRFQSSLDPAAAADLPSSSDSKFGSLAKDFNDKKSSSFDITSSHSSSSKLNNNNSASSSSSYASSTENISRLLEGWMRSSPRESSSNNYTKVQQMKNGNNISVHHQYSTDQARRMANEEFESVLSFGQDMNNHNNVNAAWIRTFCSDSAINLNGSSSQDAATREDEKMNIMKNHSSIIVDAEKKQTMKSENDDDDDNDPAAAIPPFTILEKWLLDETLTGGQVEEIMQLSPIF